MAGHQIDPFTFGDRADLPIIAASYKPPPRKWVEAVCEDVEAMVAFIISVPIAATVLRVERTSPAWENFWSAADRYHAKMASISRRPVGFVKGGTILRYWLFAEIFGRLFGDSVRLTGRPPVLSEHGLALVESTVICDSDIAGQENTNVFKYLFEQVNERPQPQLASIGLQHYVREAELRTEQQEPLLLAADYLAGLFGDCPEEFVGLRSELAGDPRVTVVDHRFDVAYQAIFGNSGIGRELWPDV